MGSPNMSPQGSPTAGVPPSVEQVLAGSRAAQAGASAAQAEARAATQRAAAAESELTRTRAEYATQRASMQTAEATRGQAEQARLALEIITHQMKTESAPRGANRRWDIVDTKLLQKPQQFKGQESSWPNWSFKLLAYVACLGNRLFEAMTKCGSVTEREATNANLDEDLAGGSRQLYHMLVLLLEGKAFSMHRPIT